MTSGAGSDLPGQLLTSEAGPGPERLALAPGPGGGWRRRRGACSASPTHPPPASPASESGSRFCV